MTQMPAKLAHYRVESILGHGGMGMVYLGQDELLHRRVALKLLPPHLARDADARRRFLNEGRAAATLSHPNVAVLYEVGSDGDEMYLAMEYVPGPTLRDLIAQGPLVWPEVIDIALEVLAALREAHGKGIVHRDIKGTNIKRMPDGRIKVMDFGLAKVTGSTLTHQGSVMGTVAYMSPQQVCGEDLDGRSDLFSLGVTMYELLTGRLPFTGDVDVAIAHAILHEDPITVRELSRDVPAELEHIVFKAMMKGTAQRYQSAAEMAEDLVRFRDHDRRRRAGIHDELDLIATSEVYAVRREQFRAPLVGRDRPLARLQALHAEVRRGAGAVVCITGEAGVGKTRLLDELGALSRREGTRMLVAPCMFGGGATSYLPFADAFRAYFALRGVTSAQALQSFVVDRAPRLGGSLQVLNRFLRFTFASNGPTSEEELWEVLDLLVAMIAEERPLVLVIDDLQWADESSLRLFHFLAHRAPGRRLMLVGTYRPEETVTQPGERPHPLRPLLQALGREERFERIELQRLGREDVAAILERLYPGHAFGDELGQLLYRETEGNPFFLVEILKLLSSEGVIAERGERWVLTTALEKIEIPEKVYDVVMRRINRLQQHERDILELGAVEGDVFHSGTILRGLRIERMALLKTLQFLEQVHHLIHAAGPQYHFDHAKIREILYNSIPPELRVEYHTVVGQFLKESFGGSEDYAGIIAHNLIAADLKEEALPFLIGAAKASGRLFAHADAIHYLRRAEQVLHDLHPRNPPPERVRMLAEVLHHLADHEYAAGHYRSALQRYEGAIDLYRAGGDAVNEAELLRAIGRTQYLLGRPAQAQQTYDDAITRFEALANDARAANDPLAVAAAIRQLGKLYFFRGDLDRSLARIEEAIRIAEEHGDEGLLAASLNNLAGIHYQRGALDQALACHQRSLVIREKRHEEDGLAQSHKNIGILQYRMGELREAAVHLDEALALYRKVGDRRGEAVTLRHLGNLHYERGEHAGAQRHWEASLSLCRELGSQQDVAACLNNLGVLHLEQGRFATADRLFREVMSVLAGLGSKSQLATLHINLGDLALSLGELARAEAEYGKAVELALEMGAHPHLTSAEAGRARLATERGDLAAAREHARLALERGEPTGHLENLIKAQLAMAGVEAAEGHWPAAAAIAAQARDTARWSNMGTLEVQAGLLLCEARWRNGDAVGAASELEPLAAVAAERGFRALAAQGHDLRGRIQADGGDLAGAADHFIRSGDAVKDLLESLADDDRRAFVHHPRWRTAIGRMIDTLIQLGRREEALAYLVPLGVGVCEVEPGATGPVPIEVG